MSVYYADVLNEALAAGRAHELTYEMLGDRRGAGTLWSCGSGMDQVALLVTPRMPAAVYRGEIICPNCGRKLLIEL